MVREGSDGDPSADYVLFGNESFLLILFESLPRPPPVSTSVVCLSCGWQGVSTIDRRMEGGSRHPSTGTCIEGKETWKR